MTPDSWYRKSLLALAVIAVVSATLQTGAFSAASTERPLEVDVVDDEEAMLGIESDRTTVSEGGPNEVELLRVTNRFRDAVTVDVTGVDRTATDHPRVEDIDTSASLDPGETGTVTAIVNCSGTTADNRRTNATGTATGTRTSDDGPQRAEIGVKIEVRGDRTEVSMTRTVIVVCSAR